MPRQIKACGRVWVSNTAKQTLKHSSGETMWNGCRAQLSAVKNWCFWGLQTVFVWLLPVLESEGKFCPTRWVLLQHSVLMFCKAHHETEHLPMSAPCSTFHIGSLLLLCLFFLECCIFFTPSHELGLAVGLGLGVLEVSWELSSRIGQLHSAT